MDKSTTDQIKGAFHEVKGKVKETVGDTVGNPNLKAEGTNENLKGKLQKKLGQIEKVLDK